MTHANRIRLVGALVIVAIVVGVIVGISLGKGSSSSSGSDAAVVSTAPTTATTTAASPAATGAATLPGAVDGAPPWPANTADLAQRLRLIGLPALSAEGTALHIHQHLDIWFDDIKVPLAAGTGIDPNGSFISPLHTHDATGVIHVESPTVRTFTLGQFFDVWGVPLAASGIAGAPVGNGELLRAWVNGLPVKGDPSKIRLASHQEIVLVYGKRSQVPKTIPATYRFAPGL